MTILTRHQLAQINAMKYLTKHNKQIKFRCYFNSYSNAWEYCIYTDKNGIGVNIERLSIKVEQ